MFAANEGKKKCVKLLVSANADINKSGNKGRTALTNAFVGGYKDIVEFLIAKKADINAVDKLDKESLMIGAGKNREIIKILMGNNNQNRGVKLYMEKKLKETNIKY